MITTPKKFLVIAACCLLGCEPSSKDEASDEESSGAISQTYTDRLALGSEFSCDWAGIDSESDVSVNCEMTFPPEQLPSEGDCTLTWGFEGESETHSIDCSEQTSVEWDASFPANVASSKKIVITISSNGAETSVDLPMIDNLPGLDTADSPLNSCFQTETYIEECFSQSELPVPPINFIRQPSIPIDAVASFDSASCPQGWTEFTEGAGRVIFGTGSGNTDVDSATLTPRLTGATGGREFTTGFPASTSGFGTTNTAAGNVLASGISVYRATPSNTTVGGSAVDSNMPPFYVLKYCKKNNEMEYSVSNLVASFLGSCSAGWNEKTEMRGRFVVGEGTGNLDADGTSLLPRTLGTSGGREFTTSIPAVEDGPLVSTPGPSVVLTEVAYYNNQPIDQDLSGTKADSNMPPFITKEFCSAAGSSIEEAPSGMILAFDLSECPTGWSSYSSGKGRAIIGEGTGNTDADAAALTARTQDTTGGREYTTYIGAVDDDPNVSDPAGNYLSNGAPYTSSAPDTTIAGEKEDSNMPPYIVLEWCTKD